MIFLGATFITGLYLQQGLGIDIVTTGWILAAITPGMLCCLPLISRYYNKVGPLPFIVPGLVLMAFSMFALTWVTSATSPFVIAFLIFCEGFASSIIQTPNVIGIFAEVPSSLKSDGSALYALGKQLSATMGVALSTMTLSITLTWHGLSQVTQGNTAQMAPLFHYSFYVLGIIPMIALILCFFYDNKRALQVVKKTDHMKTEPEMGLE